MYKVNVTNNARKSLNLILKSDTRKGKKILTLLALLETSEYPLKIKETKKLTSRENTYRWRVNEYRVIGEVDDDILEIEIVKISKREDAYD